jgi:hypothetical protein
VVGVLIFRGSQAHNLPVEVPANQSLAASEVTAPVKVENTKSEPAVDPLTPEVNEISHPTELSSNNNEPSRKTLPTRQTKIRATTNEEPIQTLQSREIPAPAPAIPNAQVATSPQLAVSQVEPRKPSNKPNSSLSPQLIEPAKTAPPKAKVIQWP